MKRQLLIGSLVSAAFLYFALRGIDWKAFSDAFAQTNVWYVLIGAAFTMSGHYVRAYRWRIMLLPVRPVTTWSAFSATCIGLAFNNLLPARLGEVVRAVAIARRDRISKSAAFATIVYERVVDVFGLIVMIWFLLLQSSGPEWLQRSGIILLVLNMVLLGILYYMSRHQQSFMRITRACLRPLPDRFAARAEGWFLAFIDGLGVVRSRRVIIPMIVTSIGVWATAAIGIWFCIQALAIQVPIMASVVLVVLLPLSTMIPSAPAYVGPIQYASIVGLAIYGVDKSTSLAYSMVFQAHHFIPVTLAGLYFAWRQHITVSDATDAQPPQAPESSPNA